jgi:hypothetical protein
MKRTIPFVALSLVLVLAGAVKIHGDNRGDDDRFDLSDFNKVRIGYQINPVPLNLRGKNVLLVGLGSYIVNGQADCAGCHSTPQYEPGGDPHLGQPARISKATYLSGGGDLFGPFVPRNLTPNSQGRPGNLTLEEFLEVFEKGTDFESGNTGNVPVPPPPAQDLLQVMPWPVFRHMTKLEKRAIYEYLRAIPCIGSVNRCNPQ